MRKLMVGVTTVLLSSFLLLSVQAAVAEDGLAVGSAAPDFTLKDTNGKSVSLKSLKGKVVYLDFWATWCGPCRKALPHTQKLANRSEAKKGDLVVLAVNVREDKETVQAFLKDNQYTFRVPLDSSGSTARSYKVRGIPTFVVIDRGGKVHWTSVGSTDGLDKAIDGALKKK